MPFTFVTWNVLAPVHVKPERYPHVAASDLDGPRRLGRVLARLRALDPDVVALQEVEPDWAVRIADALGGGYVDHLVLKQQYRYEGVALFVRRAAFGPVAFDEVLFREVAPGVEQAGNVALLARTTFAGRPLVLGTTHIKWELPEVPVERHRGVIQVTELVAALPAGVPAVLSGDFNATAASPVLGPLWAAGFGDPFAGDDQPTGAFNNRATRIDFLVHSAELTATTDRLPALANDSVLPSADEPSDHLALRAKLDFI